MSEYVQREREWKWEYSWGSFLFRTRLFKLNPLPPDFNRGQRRRDEMLRHRVSGENELRSVDVE